MPHKHKRSRAASSSSYNLPPSQIAYPLSTTPKYVACGKSSKRKAEFARDDTPSAFSRLFSGYRPPRSGLDDGVRLPKKRKTSAIMSTSSTQINLPLTPRERATDAPTKQSSESLSSSATRVDSELPLNGIQKKGKSNRTFDRGRQTKMERKMQKMYEEWRKEDQRRKDRAREVNSEAEDDDYKAIVTGMDLSETPSKPKGKKGKLNRTAGKGTHNEDEDPWARFAAERKEIKSNGGLVGLHDVVQAPPRFTKASSRRGNSELSGAVLKRQALPSETR